MADIAKHIAACIAIGGSTVSEIDSDSVALSPNLQRLLERAGSLHPMIGVRMMAEPIVEFSTSNLKLATALTAISVAEPVGLYFRSLSDAGLWGTGWISMVATAGMIEPVSLDANKGQIAKLRVRLHLASSDGDTAPVVVSTASQTPAVPSAYYTLGPLTIGTALVGVQNFAFNYGYTLTKTTGENGAPYPTTIYCEEQQAEITATAEGLAYATQARIGAGSAETSVTVDFRLCSATAMPVESGGYRITAQKADVTLEQVSGRPAAVSINAALLATSFDGTNYLQGADIV